MMRYFVKYVTVCGLSTNFDAVVPSICIWSKTMEIVTLV